MRTRAVGLILLSLSVLAASACATPAARPSRHRGFFAALSEEGEPTHRRGAWLARARPADPKLQTVRLTTHLWRWPLDRVRMTSTFGERSGTFHEGIDLQAPVGTSVHAAEEGRVVLAGSQIGDYGSSPVRRPSSADRIGS